MEYNLIGFGIHNNPMMLDSIQKKTIAQAHTGTGGTWRSGRKGIVGKQLAIVPGL